MRRKTRKATIKIPKKVRKSQIPKQTILETNSIYTEQCRTIKSAEVLYNVDEHFICIKAELDVKGHFYVSRKIIEALSQFPDHFTDIEATLCYNQMVYTFLYHVIKSGLAGQILSESKFKQMNLAHFKDDSVIRRINMYKSYLLRGGDPTKIMSLDMFRLVARLSEIQESKLRDVQFMLSFIIGKEHVKFWKPIDITNVIEGSVTLRRYIVKRSDLIFIDTHYDFEHGKAVGDVMLAILFNE